LRISLFVGIFASAFLVDGDIGRVETAVQKLSPELREECEATFFEIYRMGSRAGRDAIIAASRSRDVHEPSDADLLQRLGAIRSHLTPPTRTFKHSHMRSDAIST
jgi:hypothetical protein